MSLKAVSIAIILLLLPFASSVVTANSTSVRTPEPPPPVDTPTNLSGSGNTSLQAGYYHYQELTFSETSLLAYSTVSNVTVSTAIMTYSQFDNWYNHDEFQYAYDQNGTGNRNGLIETPGSYYFVFWAYSAPAYVSYLYNSTSSFKVENASTYVGQFNTIAAGTFNYFELHLVTLGASFGLTIFGVSNESVDYEIFDATTNSTVFSSPSVTVTNISAVSLTYNLTLPAGRYYLFIRNSSPMLTAYDYFSYVISPSYVNPFLQELFFGPSSPRPTGIASFGIENNSGVITPYSVATTDVRGYARILSLEAYNATSSSVDIIPSAATLQLNTVLVVDDASGTQEVYWPQNVLHFDTNYSVVFYVDNVLNITGDGAYLTNQSITSQNGGYVVQYDNDGTLQDYYGIFKFGPGFAYALPLEFNLLMNASIQAGSGVLLSMGMQLLQNGSSTGSSTLWFDNIMIHDPSATSAFFYVSGNQTTPLSARDLFGSYYDSEFVFGGGGNGEQTSFTELNAQLGLDYYVSSSNTFTPYPSYFNFGGDTGEAADNIQVQYLGSGLADLSPGTPVWSYLGSASISTTGSSTSSTSSASSSEATSTPTVSPTLTSTPSTSQTAARSPGSSFLYLALIVVVVVVVVAAALFLRARRTLPPPPPPPTY